MYYAKLKTYLDKTILKKKERTFLEDINPTLILGRLFGNVFVTFEGDLILKTLLIPLPFHLAYIFFCGYNYKDVINLFLTFSMYNRASDYLVFLILIVGTILRPIDIFLKRNQHRDILTNIEKLNQSLGISKQPHYVIDFSLLTLIITLIFRNILFGVGLSSVEVTKPTVGSYFIFMTSFNACNVNGYINRVINTEIKKQFKVMNGKILTYQQDGRLAQVRDAITQFIKLIRLTERFNDVCLLPMLIFLSLHGSLSIWTLHCAILCIMLQLPNYKSTVLLAILRLVINFVEMVDVIQSWDSIREEVRIF